MDTFADYGIDTRGRRGGRLKTVCPQCRDGRSNPVGAPSLSVDIDRGVWFCHYCGWKGHLRDDQGNWLALKPEKKSYRRPEPRRIGEPDAEARAWFSRRGISAATLARAHVDTGTEYFPARRARLTAIRFNYLLCGELINVKSRSLEKDFALTPGAELIPWNIDAIAGTDECIITEGEIDALSFMEAGRTDVVSVPNGAAARLSYLDDFIESHFDNKRKIYIAVDTDTAGLKLRDELLRRLGEDRCAVVVYGADCKDANELLMRGGTKALTDALAVAELPPVPGLADLPDYEAALDDIYLHGFPPGLTTGWANFDAQCRMETGRVCVVTGIPSSGKSEFVDELVIRYISNHDMTAAYYSPENYPTEYHALKFVEKIGGTRCEAGSMSRAVYEAAKAWVGACIHHIVPEGTATLDAILDLARKAVRRYGVNIVVLDPFNRIDKDPGYDTETEKISRMLDKLTAFAQKYGCLVIVVAHPRKTGPADGDAGVPNMYSINGSANFFNKADFGLTVHRDTDQGNVLVRVHKVKFRQLGEKGDVRFFYDMRCGRYTPCVEGEPATFDTRPWVTAPGEAAPPATDAPLTARREPEF